MKPARIIVLVIALVAGAIAAFLANRPEQAPPPAPPVAQLETVDVLIANADIGLGSTVTAQDLRWQTWPAAAAGASFIRKSDRPDAIEQLAGSITRASFSAGEPIREAKLIRAKGSGYMAAILPGGMRAVSTEISPETGVGGFVLPNVRVLAIDQTVEEKAGQRVVVGKIATLELTPRQVETLALARQMGTLSLALRSLVDFEGKGAPELATDEKGRRGGINMVRYGVTTMTTPK